MTTTYEIRRNNQYNSNEIYFSGKPSEKVRDALKSLQLRWNGKKLCWYGFADENAIISAINSATPSDETGGTFSDGYLGAVRWDGLKSDKKLYGSDLSAAIRADLKLAGIKGATVSVKSYAGGQSITVKARLSAAEYLTEAEYVNSFQIGGNCTWIYTSADEQPVFHEAFWAAPMQEREEIRVAAARYSYRRATTKEQRCHRAESAEAITNDAKARLRLIQDIVESYRYDDSNGMVDYFDTNFYWDLVVIPA